MTFIITIILDVLIKLIYKEQVDILISKKPGAANIIP